MNNTSEFTIDDLQEMAHQPSNTDLVRALARELLALREAGKEPVASMHRLVNKRSSDAHPWTCSLGVRQSTEGDIFRVEVIPLYAAPKPE